MNQYASMSIEQLFALNKQIVSLIKAKRSQTALIVGATFQVGQQVEFIASLSEEPWIGKIESIGPRNAKVNATSQINGTVARWTVPVTKLKAVSTTGNRPKAPKAPAKAYNTLAAYAGMTAGQKAAMTRRMKAEALSKAESLAEAGAS